jgi:hypothetical protein
MDKLLLTLKKLLKTQPDISGIQFDYPNQLIKVIGIWVN